jgi:hypothetical protein
MVSHSHFRFRYDNFPKHGRDSLASKVNSSKDIFVRVVGEYSLGKINTKPALLTLIIEIKDHVRYPGPGRRTRKDDAARVDKRGFSDIGALHQVRRRE